MALNHKLQTFVDVYDGDANKAADIAGISQQYGRALMMSLNSPYSKPKAREVQEAIRQRKTTLPGDIVGEIANRAQRQAFWTEVYQDEKVQWSDRLRASELLGKSEADFIDVVKAEHTMRLSLGAPRKAVDGRTLAEGSIEPPRAIEGSTGDG